MQIFWGSNKIFLGLIISAPNNQRLYLILLMDWISSILSSTISSNNSIVQIQWKNFQLSLNHVLIQDLRQKPIAKNFCKNFLHIEETNWQVLYDQTLPVPFKRMLWSQRMHLHLCLFAFIWVQAQIIHMVPTAKGACFCYIHVLYSSIKYLCKMFEVFDHNYIRRILTNINEYYTSS